MNKNLRAFISLVMLAASVVVMILGFFVRGNETIFLYFSLILVYLSIIFK